jgi:hypothetical protein
MDNLIEVRNINVEVKTDTETRCDENEDIVKYLNTERDFNLKGSFYYIWGKWQNEGRSTGTPFVKSSIKETTPERKAGKNPEKRPYDS